MLNIEPGWMEICLTVEESPDEEWIMVRYEKPPEGRAYLLVAMPGYDENGKVVAADQIALQRLRAHRWPLYEHTKNRVAIKSGDPLLIYIGGTGLDRQSIIAKARVIEKRVPSRRDVVAEIDRHQLKPTAFIIDLAEIQYIQPLVLRAFAGRLSFLKNAGAKWANSLVGGCRSMPLNDYNALCIAAKELSDTHRVTP
jgi:hypothetical protein